MATYATDAVSRRAMREAYMIHAIRDAIHAGQTIRCRAEDHAVFVDGVREGCQNDGTNCLCWCHDPEEEQLNE